MIGAAWSWFTGSRFYGWIIGAVGVLAAAAALYFKGRSAGKEVVREEVAKRDVAQVKATAETIREVANAQSEVTRLPDSDVRERLRERWTRRS